MDKEHHDDIFEYSRPVTREMKRVKVSECLCAAALCEVWLCTQIKNSFLDDEEEEEEESVDTGSYRQGLGAPAASSPALYDFLIDDGFDVNSRRCVWVRVYGGTIE